MAQPARNIPAAPQPARNRPQAVVPAAKPADAQIEAADGIGALMVKTYDASLVRQMLQNNGVDPENVAQVRGVLFHSYDDAGNIKKGQQRTLLIYNLLRACTTDVAKKVLKRDENIEPRSSAATRLSEMRTLYSAMSTADPETLGAFLDERLTWPERITLARERMGTARAAKEQARLEEAARGWAAKRFPNDPAKQAEVAAADIEAIRSNADAIAQAEEEAKNTPEAKALAFCKRMLREGVSRDWIMQFADAIPAAYDKAEEAAANKATDANPEPEIEAK